MRLISRSLRFFFYHFYHSFAWTYDFIAALVSIGRWNAWIEATLPFIQGTNLLEIGHGPGKLQSHLRGGDLLVFGLDESMQMIRLAKRRLEREGHKSTNLTRGLAQMLPFPNSLFDSIISTFPSEYIFDPRTLENIRRILKDNGRFIVIPAAWIGGQKFLDRTAAWLFRVTGETPRGGIEAASARSTQPFEQAGFNVKVHTLEIRSSSVLILIASKKFTDKIS